MTNWNETFGWGFGKGFWYTDPVAEVGQLSDEELFWIPHAKSLCALWHIGHIARAERYHIGHFLQGLSDEQLMPKKYNVFGLEWGSPDEIRNKISDPDEIKEWFLNVRNESHKFIESLGEDDFHRIPPSSDEGHTIAQVLIQTVGHTALHIGRIQLLRDMVKGRKEQTC